MNINSVISILLRDMQRKGHDKIEAEIRVIEPKPRHAKIHRNLEKTTNELSSRTSKEVEL